MAKALEVNENTVEDQETAPPLHQRAPQGGESGGKRDQEASGQSSPSERRQRGGPRARPVTSAARGESDDKRNEQKQKLQGKALQVNENSVEDQDPA
jgi:hypothetical protein